MGDVEGTGRASGASGMPEGKNPIRWLNRIVQQLDTWMWNRTVTKVNTLCRALSEGGQPSEQQQKVVLELAGRCARLGKSPREIRLKEKINTAIKDVLRKWRIEGQKMPKLETLSQYRELTSEMARENERRYAALVKAAMEEGLTKDQKVLNVAKAFAGIPKERRDLLNQLLPSDLAEIATRVNEEGGRASGPAFNAVATCVKNLFAEDPRLARMYCSYLDTFTDAQKAAIVVFCNQSLTVHAQEQSFFAFMALFPTAMKASCDIVPENQRGNGGVQLKKLVDYLDASTGAPDRQPVCTMLLSYEGLRTAFPQAQVEGSRQGKDLPEVLKTFLTEEMKGITADSNATEVEMFLTEVKALQSLYPTDPIWEDLQIKAKISSLKEEVEKHKALLCIQSSGSNALRNFLQGFKGDKNAFLQSCLRGMFADCREAVSLIEAEWRKLGNELANVTERQERCVELLANDYLMRGAEVIRRQIDRLFAEHAPDEADRVALSFVRSIASRRKVTPEQYASRIAALQEKRLDLLGELLDSPFLQDIATFENQSESRKRALVDLLLAKITSLSKKRALVGKLFCRYLDDCPGMKKLCRWTLENKDITSSADLFAFFPKSVPKKEELLGIVGGESLGKLATWKAMTEAIETSDGFPSVQDVIHKYEIILGAIATGEGPILPTVDSDHRKNVRLSPRVADMVRNGVIEGTRMLEGESLLQLLYPGDPVWSEKRTRPVQTRSKDAKDKLPESEEQDLVLNVEDRVAMYQAYGRNVARNIQARDEAGVVQECLKICENFDDPVAKKSVLEGIKVGLQGRGGLDEVVEILVKIFGALSLPDVEKTSPLIKTLDGIQPLTRKEMVCQHVEPFLAPLLQNLAQKASVSRGEEDSLQFCRLALRFPSLGRRVVGQLREEEVSRALTWLDLKVKKVLDDLRRDPLRIDDVREPLKSFIDEPGFSEVFPRKYSALMQLNKTLAALYPSGAEPDPGNVLKQVRLLHALDPTFCKMIGKLDCTKKLLLGLAKGGQIELFSSFAACFPDVAESVIKDRGIAEQCGKTVLNSCAAIKKKIKEIGEGDPSKFDQLRTLLIQYGLKLGIAKKYAKYFFGLESEIRSLPEGRSPFPDWLGDFFWKELARKEEVLPLEIVGAFAVFEIPPELSTAFMGEKGDVNALIEKSDVNALVETAKATALSNKVAVGLVTLFEEESSPQKLCDELKKLYEMQIAGSVFPKCIVDQMKSLSEAIVQFCKKKQEESDPPSVEFLYKYMRVVNEWLSVTLPLNTKYEKVFTAKTLSFPPDVKEWFRRGLEFLSSPVETPKRFSTELAFKRDPATESDSVGTEEESSVLDKWLPYFADQYSLVMDIDRSGKGVIKVGNDVIPSRGKGKRLLRVCYLAEALFEKLPKTVPEEDRRRAIATILQATAGSYNVSDVITFQTSGLANGLGLSSERLTNAQPQGGREAGKPLVFDTQGNSCTVGREVIMCRVADGEGKGYVKFRFDMTVSTEKPTEVQMSFQPLGEFNPSSS